MKCPAPAQIDHVSCSRYGPSYVGIEDAAAGKFWINAPSGEWVENKLARNAPNVEVVVVVPKSGSRSVRPIIVDPSEHQQPGDRLIQRIRRARRLDRFCREFARFPQVITPFGGVCAKYGDFNLTSRVAQ
jgi:hypothetical protein